MPIDCGGYAGAEDDDRKANERRAAAAEHRPRPKVYAMCGVLYRHRKTGGLYEVVSIATMEATMTIAVVYRSRADGRQWVRPLDEFCDGRFAYSDDKAEG